MAETLEGGSDIDKPSKRCTKCGLVKPLEAFHRGKWTDGHKTMCADCCNAKSAAWRAANRERSRAYALQWAKANPDRHKANQRAAYRRNPERLWWNNVRRKYGLTSEQYEALLVAQQGCCAICGTSDPGAGRKYMHVDHCHSSKRVRGLLCTRCNTAIGLLDDDPERALAAAEYLRSI